MFDKKERAAERYKKDYARYRDFKRMLLRLQPAAPPKPIMTPKEKSDWEAKIVRENAKLLFEKVGADIAGMLIAILNDEYSMFLLHSPLICPVEGTHLSS
jgi:hypothetical protein